MTAWLGYVLLVGTLVGLAAAAAETAMRPQRKPTRNLWLVALSLSALLPLLNDPSRLRTRPANAPAVSASRVGSPAPQSAHTLRIAWPRRLRAPQPSPALEQWLLRLWAAGSLTCFAALGTGLVHLHRRQRRWRDAVVAGTPVLVSDDTGPAVAGVFRPRIVVPAWIAEMPLQQQALVIAHEQLHLERNDSRWITLAALLLACIPWNLPLWWQFGRLRRAIEIDCDVRVLKANADVRDYGHTLLAVGQRRSQQAQVLVAMSESPTFLQQRIALMFQPSPSRHWPVYSSALALLAFALVATAAQIQPPPDAAPHATQFPANGQRVWIHLPAQSLDRFGGYYEYGDATSFVEVKHVGDHLTVQFSGEPEAAAVYPEGPTEFFFLDTDAHIKFTVSPNGSVSTATLLQNDGSTSMPRIERATADGLRARLAQRVHSRTQTPGTQAMLLRVIDGIRTGAPPLSEMNPQLAAAIGKDLPKFQVRLAGLGSVKSVTFLNVNDAGMDVYQVQYEHGSSLWSVSVDAQGKLIGLLL